MVTQRTEGLYRLFLFCQIVIVAGLFWLGVWIMLAGTILCLVPNAPAPVRVPAPKLVGHEAAVATGD